MVVEPVMENIAGYRVIGRYRRTVSSIPARKRLVPVATLGDEPVPFGTELGQLCPDVLFYLLEDQSGARYWGKQWLNERQALLHPTLAIERFLATLDEPGLCLAVDVVRPLGLIYPFDAGLFHSRAIVHQWDHHLYFDALERRSIDRIASTTVDWPGLPAVRLGTLTDFQVARIAGHLVFLDFEPSAHYAATLAGVTI